MNRQQDILAISVVIPQWGQCSLTAHVIDRLRRYELHETEITVVDDGSPELAKCEFINDCRVRFLGQRHRGVTSAWNRGAGQACGTYLVFLNNDVQIEERFLSRLVRPLEDYDVVVSGCRWRQERGVPPAIASDLPRELLEGWCFAVRRADFESIGGFDERFRVYFSDTDLQWRLLAQKSDSRLECVPNLPISHEGHVSTRTDPRRREHHTQDRRAFLQKWSSL
jgi:GT2 family glycosyltransferase